jgi:hypothetical protein
MEKKTTRMWRAWMREWSNMTLKYDREETVTMMVIHPRDFL